MALLITSQDLESHLKHDEDTVYRPLGFLNSSYQQIVKSNYSKMNTSSVFGIRQRLKSRQFNTCCPIETILKVSLFFIVIVIAVI